MSSALCATDNKEFRRVKRNVIRRLARPSRSLRIVIHEIDLDDVMGPDLTSLVDYLAHTDEVYIRTIVSGTHHAEKRAHCRYQMIRRAVNQLHRKGQILTGDHVVHPDSRPGSRSNVNEHRPKRRKKFDQRPYHGRPGRDRRRLPQSATT